MVKRYFSRMVTCVLLAFAVGVSVRSACADALTATNIVVRPLSDVYWTQNAPYNDYSPRGKTVFTSGWEAGCVAIAAAQELYYWQWPRRLDAVHETSHPVLNESNLALRFDGHVPFDWASMTSGSHVNDGLKGKHAVAHLVLACQSLVQMQFVSAGGLASKNLPGTMEWYEYAGQVTPRASDANLAALRADFEFGSPVQTGINFKGYGGHEVLGLGYATGTNSVGEAKNLIWLNLGWGGSSDGWYDIGETDSSETIIKSVQLGFRPIKSVQIDPVAPVSGSEVTLNWHLPNCYTNKVSGFTVATKKLGAATTTWSDDFSAVKGRSNNTNEVRIVNGALKAWDGTASGMYIWDEVFEPTADSVLSYDVGSSYMSGMSVRFEAKVDGVWQSFHAVNVNGGKEADYFNWGTTKPAEPVSLASFAGKQIQLRFVVEYTTGGIFTSDDASVKIDNLSVSNVKMFETVATDDTIAASARSATFSSLENGETYAFSVTPIMSDNSAAVTQTATTTIGNPAEKPVINAVTMSPKGTDLVQDGFYAGIAMGWNIIDVACSESVTSLEAFMSHQSVLPQSKIEVVDNGSGSFSININATEVAEKWANQKMILTLKATNATGESAYKDVELCLKASGVPENVPGGKVWTVAAGFEGDVVVQPEGMLILTLTDSQVAYGYTASTVTLSNGATLRFVDESAVTIAYAVSGDSYVVSGSAKVWSSNESADYSAKWSPSAPSDGDYVTFKSTGDDTVLIDMDLSSNVTVPMAKMTGSSLLYIAQYFASGSGIFTAEVMENDTPVELATSLFKVNSVMPSANVIIDNGSCLDCEIDQSRSGYLKKVVSGGYVSALTDSSLWNGTVVFSGYVASGENLSDYGNTESTVRLNGVAGWLATGNAFNPVVELVDDGTTPALDWNNGSTGAKDTIKKLKGTGTFKTSGTGGAAERVIINDIDDFTGSFDLSLKRIAVGENEPTTSNNGSISVNSGKSVTVHGGSTWKASGGFYFGGSQTITVNGALNGAISADGTDTVLALAPTATVSAASLSFMNNTIRLAMTAVASPTFSVTGAANLTNATIEVALADGMSADDSIALMSAGSFEGVDSVTLSGLDGYSLEVSGGTLYAVNGITPTPDATPLEESEGFVTSEYQLAFKNATLDQLTAETLGAKFSGGWVTNKGKDATICNFVIDGSILTCEAQIDGEYDEGTPIIKAICLEFAQVDDDIYVKATEVKYKANSTLGEALTPVYNTGTLATTEYAEGYSIYNLTLIRPEEPAYAGPEPTAVWQTGEFGKTKNDYAISLNGNTINDDGNIVIGNTVSEGVTIDIQSVLGNAGRDVSVLVKYSNASAPAERAVFACVYVDNNGSYDTGLASSAANAGTLVGYYNATSPYTMKNNGSNIYPNPAATESGYLLFSYKHKTENDVTKGVYAYNGAKLDSMTGGSNDGLCWPDRRLSKVAIGGPSGSISSTYAKWPGLVIEKVAIFVGKVLTNEDIANYQFPEVQEPEELATGANLVNGETVTYSKTIEGAIFPGLFMALGANPNAYVQVLDPNAETPNVYGHYNIAYDTVNRRYCKAVTKINNGTLEYPAFINLADAWAAAGKGADTATINILSTPSDSVTIGAGETLKVTGAALTEANVLFGENLMHFTTTSGGVTTYTARNKGATLPGINTNVPMTVGDFALDSTGEWAEIFNAPIRMTLDPSVNRFKLSFDVDIPDGVYGTLFSWDSTDSDTTFESRVVVTNEVDSMVVYRQGTGALTTVGYVTHQLIPAGQHTITMQWVYNAGCKAYVDGDLYYSSENLKFSDYPQTTTLAIGGSALGSPVDVLAGLKIKNFTYNVYSDAVTRLDGTIYHGNDANRLVITNYLSQMVGHRPVKMPAPATVDLLLVYDPNAVDYATNHYATVEEHAAHNVAVMNQALTTTDIDTNVWFRIAGIYEIDVAAANVDDALKRLNGTVAGWEQVASERERVGADVVLGVIYSNSNYGLANWCSPTEIINGGGANYAFAGVRADAAWSWVHEVGHTASLYHSPGEAAGSYNNPTSVGCGFSKTAEADMAELRSIMASGTAQLAFSSPNHMSHGEIYSVTNSVGEYVDSSGELARLLPYMANYRDTVVNAWSITPQNGSTVKSGDTMTITCEDPEATIWYSLYGSETETQYTEPVAINTSSIYSIYNITIKKGDEEVVTTQIVYYPDQTQVDPVARIDGGNGYDTLQGAIDAAESGATIILLKSSSEVITLNKTIVFSEGENATFSGTFTGSGTLKLGAFLKNSKTPNGVSPLATGWTGTVEFTSAFAANGQNTPVARYGNANSTIKLTGGMTGGWLANAALDTTIELEGNMTLSDFSTSFANTIKKLTGTGTFSITYSTEPNLTDPGYYPYYLIKDVSGFEGSLTIPDNGTIGIVVGTNSKPSDKTHGGKILVYTNVVASANWTAPNGIVLADAEATLTVADNVTVSTVDTTLSGYGVVRNGNVYSVEQVTNTDYKVPYSWFASYDSDASVANEKAANDVNTWWQCYVLGLDPTNETSKFETTIKMVDGSPVVEYSPTNTTLPTLQYILQGKPLLNNDWQDVEFDDPGDTNRFFRVKIKWE